MPFNPTIFLFMFVFAAFNRARGSQLFGLVASTTLGRFISMLGMSLMISFYFIPGGDFMLIDEILFWALASLEFWCVFRWDSYWSAEIGYDPNHSRLWGLGAMTFRMALIIPCIVGLAVLAGHPTNAIYALGFLLMGLPYYVWGYITKIWAVEWSEYTVGAILGAMVFLTIGG